MEDYRVDVTTDFIGGQDASKIADRVPANAYFMGVNVTTKKASLGPRWGFERKNLIFPKSGRYDREKHWRSDQNSFEAGKFQAAFAYRVGAEDFIGLVIGGVTYLWNVRTGEISLVPVLDGSVLNPRAPRINWSDANGRRVLFDFPSYPLILENFSLRRADPNNYEIPISNIGAYNQNRLFIGNALNELTAGDPVGNLAAIDPPITFEEVLAPAGTYFGQIFQLPTSDSADKITAMGFLQTADTSTGIGPLIVGSENAVFTYATQNLRSDWEAGQFGSLLIYNYGIAGPRSLCNVGSDAFFRSRDGHVRTLSMSREEQKRWSKVPISREVEVWFKNKEDKLNSFGTLAYFKNKVFFTVNPYRVPAQDYYTRAPISDYAHGGMIVLEMDNLTSFGEASKPTWAGLWTGVNPMEFVNIGERLFIISKDNERLNRIYEVNPEINYDTADTKIRRVRSVMYTREYDCQNPFENKELHTLDLNFDTIKGDFLLQVDYKPSHSENFIPWRTFEYNAPWRACCPPGDAFINGFAAHIIRDFTLGAPNNLECSPINQELFRVFRKVQLRMIFEGIYWELHELRVKAIFRPKYEAETVCNLKDKYVCIPKECFNDWFVGDFDLCQTETT